MARKTNYNFDKRQREIQKKEKKAAKLEAKRLKAEERKDDKAPDEQGALDSSGETGEIR
jgi:hypothetical protein